MAQKGPKEPKGAQQCQTEMNSDFLSPADQGDVKNAKTFQKGFSLQYGPKKAQKSQKRAQNCPK